MNFSPSQKRLILIVSLILIGVWIVHTLIVHKDNFWNLTGLFMGLITLFFTIEDKRNTRIVKAFDDISQAIRDVKIELKSEMQARDLGHDQHLNELSIKVSFIEQRLDLHCDLFGHPKLVEELFTFKDKMSELNAAVMMMTQQGRTERRLDKAELMLQNLLGDKRD